MSRNGDWTSSLTWSHHDHIIDVRYSHASIFFVFRLPHQGTLAFHAATQPWKWPSVVSCSYHVLDQQDKSRISHDIPFWYSALLFSVSCSLWSSVLISFFVKYESIYIWRHKWCYYTVFLTSAGRGAPQLVFASAWNVAWINVRRSAISVDWSRGFVAPNTGDRSVCGVTISSFSVKDDRKYTMIRK